MKKKQGKRHLRFGIVGLLPALIMIVIGLAGCAGSEPTEGKTQSRITLSEGMPRGQTGKLWKAPRPVTGLSPANPQPVGTELVPGLAVVYFPNYPFKHLDPLTKGDWSKKKGTPGKPIPFLNQQFGRYELDYKRIAMRMRGLLHFPQTGSYTLLGFCNDGIRIYVSDQIVIEEPGFENPGDRYTAAAIAEITQAGWYPIKVEFYQHEGSTSIGFFWRRPGADGFEPVPAEAYAHIPGSGS